MVSHHIILVVEDCSRFTMEVLLTKLLVFGTTVRRDMKNIYCFGPMNVS